MNDSKELYEEVANGLVRMRAEFQALTCDVAPAVFGLVVGNLMDIANSFGEEVAARVLVELAQRVERISGLPAHSVVISANGVLLSVAPEKPVELLVAAVAPVCIGDARVVMALSVTWVNSSLSSTCGDSAGQGFAEDMVLASKVYEAVRAGRSRLLIQPIGYPAPLGSSDETLYWECLSRLTDKSGGTLSPAMFIPALERLRLTRFFDVHVVQSTIDLLKLRKEVSLGCNISAQSAIADEWWSGVVETLADDPEISARLVIEITESSPVEDIPGCINFVERMRSLGCRIAFDDFGKGFHSIELARECRPDIIKIDAGFLPRGDRKENGAQLFASLISLANALTDVVVVEGIEDETDQAMALDCGGVWMQGYHLAKPSVPVREQSSRFAAWGERQWSNL